MPFPGLKKTAIFGSFLLPTILLTASFGCAQSESNRRTPLIRASEKVGPVVVNINTEEAPTQRRNAI